MFNNQSIRFSAGFEVIPAMTMKCTVTLSLFDPNILNALFKKHDQSVFLPECHTPSFTPVQNHTQNYTYFCMS
jgi:hypothetical protein